jgi:predicted DNA-binding transcriptional regulator AlpA
MLTTADLAEILRLDRKHVQNVVIHRDGFPKPYRLGGCLRWTRADIQNYVAKCRA